MTNRLQLNNYLLQSIFAFWKKLSKGFSGHKKVKGDKVVAFCNSNGKVIAPFVSALGKRNEVEERTPDPFAADFYLQLRFFNFSAIAPA